MVLSVRRLLLRWVCDIRYGAEAGLLARTLMLASLLWFPGGVDSGEFRSQYVSLQAESCKAPSESVNQYYSSRDLSVIECQTGITVRLMPLTVLVVSSSERSWLDLVLGGTIWSSENEVVYEKENQFGYFPNVGNAPVEIRMSRNEATGLIFRVTAQAPDRPLSGLGASNVSRLFVIGFRESGACFLGISNANTIARKQLDSRTVCKRMLEAGKLQ